MLTRNEPMQRAQRVEEVSTRRTFLRLAIVAIMAICALSSTPPAGAATLSAIRQRGYMVIATEDDCPPFEYTSNTKFVGFDNELLALLAPSVPYAVRQRTAPWPEVERGLISGEYDAAVTAAIMTPAATKRLDFTTPIAQVTMTYISLTADTSIRSVADLSGKTLAVQSGGASRDVIPELKATIERSGGTLGRIVEYRTYAEAYEDLVRRRIDAVVNTRESLAPLVRRTSDLFELGSPVGPKLNVAWAVRKGNRSVLQSLNNFLYAQRTRGTLKQLQTKYGLAPDSPSRP
jgi:polar amino acid transport system substrate-binding protein